MSKDDSLFVGRGWEKKSRNTGKPYISMSINIDKLLREADITYYNGDRQAMLTVGEFSNQQTGNNPATHWVSAPKKKPDIPEDAF